MRKRPLEFLALLYLIIWTVSPPLQIGMLYRLAAMVCAGFLFIRNRFVRTTEHDTMIIFCGLVAVSAIIQIGSLSAVLRPIGTYMLFVGYMLNYWYEYEWESFADIVPITLLILAVWNITSFRATMIYANVSRLIVRNDEVANALLRRGIGGYALLYCQVIIFPAIVQWILYARKFNRFYFACGLIWAVTFAAFLANAGYTVAIVTCAVSLVALFGYRRKEILPAIIITAIVMALGVYLIAYNDLVRNFLLKIFDGTKIARKIMDITSTVTTDETADSVVSRMSKYSVSLRSIFVEYPLIGSWWKAKIGGHSSLLDPFAQYGMVGGVLIWRMIFCVTNKWKRYNIGPKLMRVVNASIISISLVAGLNPVPYNLSMMLLVVLPIILCTIAEWRIKNNENLMDSEPDTN